MTKPSLQQSEELQVSFGESVRHARTKAGLSQSELAVRTGIAQQEISRIERGEINLTLRTMSRLAAVLDGSVAQMLDVAKDNRDVTS